MAVVDWLAAVPTKRLRFLFQVAALVLAVAQACIHRFSISSYDAVAYLDIATAYANGDWRGALNAHWSPLYSWVLAGALKVISPSAYWELPLLRLINILIYAAALLGFDFFLRQLMTHTRNRLDPNAHHYAAPDWVWLTFGYTLFIWSSLSFITIHSDTPDMLTAGLIFVATGLLLRTCRPDAGMRHFIALGAVLGTAYLAKAALLPISLLFLAAGFLWDRAATWHRRATRLGVSLLALAVVAAPFILFLTQAKQRLTVGDAGRYVAAVFVNPGDFVVPLMHWQGDPPGFGVPLHPTRKIATAPNAFEFATPVGGSYPPWHDPSYWYDGLQPHFDLKRYTAVLLKNVVFCWNAFLAGILFGVLALGSGADQFRSTMRGLAGSSPVLVPALGGIGFYMLATDLILSDIPSQPAMRYVAGFVVLLAAGLFAGIRIRDTTESSRPLRGSVIALCGVAFISIIVGVCGDRMKSDIPREHRHWLIAQELAAAGIGPGREIARLGGASVDPPYWARLAGLRIVAEVPSTYQFWTASKEKRAATLQAIAATGAKAIVQIQAGEAPMNLAREEGWRQIGERPLTGEHEYLREL